MSLDDEPRVRVSKGDNRCRCGGHHGGAKSNRHHHGTLVKMLRRFTRRVMRAIMGRP